MGELIKFVLSNYTLTFLVFGLFCFIVDLVLKPKPLHKQQIIEALFSLLWSPAGGTLLLEAHHKMGPMGLWQHFSLALQRDKVNPRLRDRLR